MKSDEPKSEIPAFVKLQGRKFRVDVSGRGYVKVGDAIADARNFFDSALEWEKFKSDSTPAEWQAVMKRCFDAALVKAREQARKGGRRA